MNRIKPSPYLKELVCLYVEDDEFIRESFAFMIQRYFKKVIIATNGKEGLEKYEEFKPDIVISDIRMPIMNGIEMVKKIKEKNPYEFVIFITAFTDVEYLKEAIDLGVEGYLTKPIDKQKLLKKLNSLAEFLKQKKEVKELMNLLQEVFNKQPNPTVLLENRKIKLINKAFSLMFPNIKTFEELIEKIPIDLSKAYQEITISLNDKKITLDVNIQNINKNYTLIVLNDISDFEKEILTDSLTGLYNRKILEKVLSSFVGFKKCVILFDIDNFKQINDRLGHNVGDEILKTLSQIVKNSLRKSDVVIRWGGEEFLVILDNVENSTEAAKVAEILRQKIASYNFEKIDKVTCSFGVGCMHLNKSEDFYKLVEKADKALYKAKNEGKNRVES